MRAAWHPSPSPARPASGAQRSSPYSGTAPAPPTNLAPAPPWNDSICFTYYTTVRVLPFDDALPARFIGSQSAVEANINAIWALTSQSAAAESTFAHADHALPLGR